MWLLQHLPVPTDGLETHTSKAQASTESLISALFDIAHLNNRTPTLNRAVHLNWLIRLLLQGFPSRYISQDASQPWLLYFVLQSFQTLGVAFDPDTRKKAIATIMAKQHPDGGFGGGPGQLPHLLPTYASVCSLAIVGQPGEGGGWDQIDRQKMYRWFLSLKQPDGSFIVNQNGEVDIRGIYCLLVTATLLDMLTPELTHNTIGFIQSLQTYEGGFASASQPYYAPGTAGLHQFEVLHDPRPTLGEAHGGYTSCAVASLLLLRPLLNQESRSTPSEFPRIDTESLLRWAVHLQGSEYTDGGGFRGRTNKLVDGCYGWWVGGCFCMIQELLGDVSGESVLGETPQKKEDDGQNDEDWDDFDDSLFNRQALQNYILLVAQSQTGGLRDKPNTNPDAYHTLYNLAGLSASQHRVYSSKATLSSLLDGWKINNDCTGFIPEHITAIPTPTKATCGNGGVLKETEAERQARRKTVYAETLAWIEDEGASKHVGGKDNRVASAHSLGLNATHPLVNLTMSATKGIMQHFYHQTTAP